MSQIPIFIIISSSLRFFKCQSQSQESDVYHGFFGFFSKLLPYDNFFPLKFELSDFRLSAQVLPAKMATHAICLCYK